MTFNYKGGCRSDLSEFLSFRYKLIADKKWLDLEPNWFDSRRSKRLADIFFNLGDPIFVHLKVSCSQDGRTQLEQQLGFSYFHRILQKSSSWCTAMESIHHPRHLRCLQGQGPQQSHSTPALVQHIVAVIRTDTQQVQNDTNIWEEFSNFDRWTLNMPFGRCFIYLYLHKKCKYMMHVV